jgi:hypothetical protein
MKAKSFWLPLCSNKRNAVGKEMFSVLTDKETHLTEFIMNCPKLGKICPKWRIKKVTQNCNTCAGKFMGEEICPRQGGVQSRQQNAKNLAISAQNGGIKK